MEIQIMKKVSVAFLLGALLALSSCQFDDKEDLVEYLQTAGLPTESAERQLVLAPPVANVKSGTTYKDSERYDFELSPSRSTTDGSVNGIPNVTMVYSVSYCDLTASSPVFETLVEETSTTETYTAVLRTGLYYVQAYETAPGYIDSEVATWNFGVGQVASMQLNIEWPPGLGVRASVSFDTNVFSKKTFSSRNAFTLTLTVTDEDGNALDSSLASVTEVAVMDRGTKSVLPEIGSLSYRVPEECLYEQETDRHEVQVTVSCMGMTSLGRFYIWILD